MSLFSIRDLVKIYGTRKVLDIEVLDIEKGRIYALFGPNGSGKTTLLEILSLLARPSGGKVYYKGNVIDYSSADLTGLRREIVMVHQQPVLFSTSVLNNVEFGLKVRGMDKPVRRKIVEEALELVGMRDFIHTHAPSLSGGEKQRVAIARALACSPKVLFLDEPTASVDVENQAVIEGVVSEINEDRGITIVITTHDISQARRMSHEMIPIFGGRIGETVQENIFSVTLSANGSGSALCKIKGGPELLMRAQKGGRARISIDPCSVEILKEKKDSPNDANIVMAQVRQLTADRDNIRVMVDMGVPLYVVIARQEALALGIFVGDSVWVCIPYGSIKIL